MDQIDLEYLPQTLKSNSPSRTTHSRNEKQLVMDYLSNVTAIARFSGASQQYYEQLVRYLSGKGGFHQAIKIYSVGKGHDIAVINQDLFQDDPSSFTKQEWPCIAVLEGFPSPQCIAWLGNRFKLGPELFIENLDFSRNISRGTVSHFYELPAPAPAPQSTVHFRFVSLGTFTSGNLRGQPTEFQKALNVNCLQNESNLFDSGLYGVTRWRRVQVHGVRHWSLEQTLSFAVSSDEAGWSAIFLTDLGSSVVGSFDGMPWHTAGCGADGRPVGTIPLIAAGATCDRSVSSGTGRVSASQLDQLHPLRYLRFRDPCDYDLFAEDPFYLYQTVLRTMLACWSQLVNFLEIEIDSIRNTSSRSFDIGLEELRLMSSVLYRARGTILEHSPVLTLGGKDNWRKASCEKLVARKSTLQRELSLAIEGLVDRYTHLLHECQTVSQLLVSSAQVAESQKAIQQSNEVNALTKLAFTFLPVSLVAGIFSMEVVELSYDPPRIWVFFAIAGPVGLIFGLLATELVRRLIHQFLVKLRGHFRTIPSLE